MRILREHLELELQHSIVDLKSVACLDWGEKVKLRNLGRNLGCTFETSRLKVLVVVGGQSQDQGKGQRFHSR